MPILSTGSPGPCLSNVAIYPPIKNTKYIFSHRQEQNLPGVHSLGELRLEVGVCCWTKTMLSRNKTLEQACAEAS